MKYLPFALALASACAAAPSSSLGAVDAKPASDLDPAGHVPKADSFYDPTVHPLELGTPTGATLADHDRYHAFDFELHGDATVALTTGGPDPYLDTVVYLFRWDGTRWGSYIAKNDDAPGLGYFSRLEEALGVGSYRLMVRGYDSYVRGPFTLDSDCTGAGCAPTSPGLPGEGQDCTRTEGCAGDLRCEGFVAEAGAGKCIALGALPGEGATCGTDHPPCDAGLVCAGNSLDPSWGLCNPAWMQGTFRETPYAPIPDVATIERTLHAYGLATVSTDVRIDLSFTHTYPGDLRIVLANPLGTEAVVFDGETDAYDGENVRVQRALAGFPGDEDANGAWTLRITDREARDTGTLQRWALEITSRWD